MSSQPPSSTSLPSGLHNTSPPTFAAFKFSPNFGGPRAQTDQNPGRLRTLTERMVLGPRVIPFKPTSTPSAGLSSLIKVKPPATLDTDMLDTSVDGGKQPQTSPLPAPSVDIPPLNSAAEASSQETESPPDIWEHAKLVQNEWASVERTSLPSVIHQAMGEVTLEDNTIKGTQGPQKMAESPTTHPKNEHTLPPTGLAPRGMPPSSVSSSRGPEKVKREEDEVKVKQEEEVKVKHEELEPSLPRSNGPVFTPQHQPKSEPSPTLTFDVPVKKEEVSDQYFGAAAQRAQPSTRINTPPNPPFVSKKVEERIMDLPQAKNTFENHHVIRENGTLNHAHSDMKPASPPTKEFGAEETTNRTGGKPPMSRTSNAKANVDVNPPSSRQHYTPLQISSISKPILSARASPPLVQTLNRQGNEPTGTYQGNTHREPASIQPSDPRLKPSSGPTDPLANRANSTFAGPRDASDERGRTFMRSGSSTLPTRPNDSTGGYRRYSPRRGNSPPHHSDRNFEDWPITRTPPRVDPIRPPPRRHSPHTPPRRHSPHTPPPRTYPLPTLPRSRSPLRRSSDAYNRQNEHAGDSYRPPRSRSRSRSPRRRWAEREYARDQMSPRGLRNGDMKRGPVVTYPAHNIRPRSEWRTTANNNTPEPYRRKFEDPYLTRSPEGMYDSYRPTQPMPSRQPARNGRDSYRPRRGSSGSDRQSPISVEWEESTMSAGGNARRALSRVVSDPETPHRSSSIEGDASIPRKMEPYRGLKRRAEEEPQTELAKQSPVSGPERATKRRKIDEMDVEMDVSLANPGNSGSVLESIPPTNAGRDASVGVTQPPSLEEYPSIPPLIPTGNQNKLLMRMVSSAREPMALTPNSSDDPDDALRYQNMRGASTSSLTTRDAMDNTNPPAIARVSLKDRIHRNQSQNNPQPPHTDSTLPSLSNTQTEEPPSRSPTLRRIQHASTSETHQSAVGLLRRIDFNQASVSQFGDHVVEAPDLRGSRQPRPRVLSGNDQDAFQPLQARVGLRADEAAPQRPRQGSKGGRGGNLVDRLD